MATPLQTSDHFTSGQALIALSKAASNHTASYNMAGRLQLTNGWLVLSVPASLVRGAFDALHEPGLALPQIFAIPVMSPQELAHIGGADKITERGHSFRYSIRALRSHEPGNSFSRVYYLGVVAPELRKLRLSYGLSGYPKGDCFQLPIGTRAIGVLGSNSLTKLASCFDDLDPEEFDLEAIKEAVAKIPTVAVDLDGTLAEYDRWRGEDHFGKPREGARKALKEFEEHGYRIIIHTTRGAKDKIRNWLEKNDIPFDYINENPDQPPNSSNKIIADVYIDDRAINAKQPWDRISAATHVRIKAGAVDENPSAPTGHTDEIMVDGKHKPKGQDIYLVRHGSTPLNQGAAQGQDRIRGCRQIELDEEGRRESHELAEYFKDIPVERVYASNLIRTEYAAKAIADKIGVDTFKADYAFRPWCMGDFQGEIAKEVHPKLMDYAKNKPLEPVPHGENFASFKHRFCNALEHIMEGIEKGEHGTAVIVCHFRNLKLTQAWLATDRKKDEDGDQIIDFDTFFKNDVPVGAIMKLTLKDGKWDWKLLTPAAGRLDSAPAS